MLDYEWGNPSAMMQLPGEEPELPHHHHNHNHNHGPDPTRQSFLDLYGSHSQTAFNDDNNNNNNNNTNNHHFLTNANHHEHDDHHHHHHHNHHNQHHDLSNTVNSNNNTSTFSNHLFNPNPTHHQPLHHHHHHHHSLFDPRAYASASSYAPQSILSLDAPPFMLIPKTEDQSAVTGLCRPAAVDLIGSSRIGLNLGGRTYFSSSEDDFMSRLYRRPRAMEQGSAAANAPRCQAEGCNADLSHAKHYHRRHKVCEFHSKASTVIAAGLTQRFCQQCSRFHLLSEFDNGKRSCRKRLADHNRRRRKTQSQQPSQDNPKPSSSQPEDSRTNNNPSSDHSVPRSPPDSGAQSSSSVTVAVSPPRMSLDCFRQRSIYQATASSGSSNSLFFSSG